MRKFVTVVLLCELIALSLGIRSSYASEVDVLLKKLVEKGILNASEAQEIRTETNDEIAKTEKQKQEDYKTLAKDSMPDWVKNTKLKGDFRLRYEWTKDKVSSGDITDRSRARIRARLGVESQVNNKLTMAVGIATGKQTDPRTRNVTLGNDVAVSDTPGSPKTVVLDYAYAQYKPAPWATFTGGKFQNPLWRTNDWLWKDDITPEGAAVNLNYKFMPNLELFMNDMYFIFANEDKVGSKWPTVTAIQPGFNLGINAKTNFKAAVAYYLFSQVKGYEQFKNSSKTNTFASNSSYLFNYNSVNPSAELGFKEPFGDIPVLNGMSYFGLFGDFIYNVSSNVTTSKSGFDAGFKFGNEQVSDWGQWQTKILYARLGRDAWLDALTDVDRYGGKTNTKGIIAKLDYGLGKNTWLTFKYYHTTYLTKDYQGVSGTSTQIGGYAPEQLLQVDWNMKF